jgi:hypothetical protein
LPKDGVTAAEYAVLLGSKNSFEEGGGFLEKAEGMSKEFRYVVSRLRFPAEGTFAEQLTRLPGVAEFLPEGFRGWHQIARDLTQQ